MFVTPSGVMTPTLGTTDLHHSYMTTDFFFYNCIFIAIWCVILAYTSETNNVSYVVKHSDCSRHTGTTSIHYLWIYVQRSLDERLGSPWRGHMSIADRKKTVLDICSLGNMDEYEMLSVPERRLLALYLKIGN